MKSSELENHIRKRLGDQSHRFNLYHDMSCLMLRYRWIGDKLFDIDPENPLAPCFLSHDDFLLFALEPSVERLRFFKTNPTVICPDIFKKLVESKRNLPWDDAYDYVDDLGICAFKYINWFLRTYRDELLKIDESIIPKGKRLITHHDKSYANVKSLLEDYLAASNSPIKVTKRDMETAMSRYRWFGNEKQRYGAIWLDEMDNYVDKTFKVRQVRHHPALGTMVRIGDLWFQTYHLELAPTNIFKLKN